MLGTIEDDETTNFGSWNKGWSVGVCMYLLLYHLAWRSTRRNDRKAASGISASSCCCSCLRPPLRSIALEKPYHSGLYALNL